MDCVLAPGGTFYVHHSSITNNASQIIVKKVNMYYINTYIMEMRLKNTLA